MSRLVMSRLRTFYHKAPIHGGGSSLKTGWYYWFLGTGPDPMPLHEAMGPFPTEECARGIAATAQKVQQPNPTTGEE